MKSKLLLAGFLLAVLACGCEKKLEPNDQQDDKKQSEIVFSETQLASYTEAQLNAFKFLYGYSFTCCEFINNWVDTITFIKICERNESFLKDVWADESECPADIYQELLPQISEYTNGELLLRNGKLRKFYINENADSLIQTDKEHFVDRRYAFTIISQDSFSLIYSPDSLTNDEKKYTRIKF